MDLSEELKEVLAGLVTAEQEIARWTARAEGLRAQRDALERALADRPRESDPDAADLRKLSRMAAIEALLRRSATPLSIRGVVDGLTAAGRTADSYSVVAATLQQLMNSRRVKRPSRGLYEAV